MRFAALIGALLCWLALTPSPVLADGVSAPGVPHSIGLTGRNGSAIKYAPSAGGGPSPPVLSVAPVVTGTATVGSTLSTTNGTWTNSPTSYTYQWVSNGSAISGATGSTYLTVSADGGTAVGSQVTADNAGGASSPASSNTLAIAPPVPVNSVAPVVSGTPAVGSTLSSTTGTWTNSPTGYTYQWLRNGGNISGATSSTYVTVSADGGTSVGSQVIASNTGGSSAPSTSNTLAIPAPYVGPLDVVSGATAWYGTRAASAAFAAAGSHVVSLRRVSDNTTCDFNIASSGKLGLSDPACSLGGGLTPTAFAGTSATATCTVSGLTMTCSGGSAQPANNSSITGAGLSQPCWGSVAGWTGSPPNMTGTVTLTANTSAAAPCGTIGTGTAMVFTTPITVTKWYDQTGHGYDLTNSTAAQQLNFMPSCLNSAPCLADSAAWVLYNTTFVTTAQPNTLEQVVLSYSTLTSGRSLVAQTAAIGIQEAFLMHSAANASSIYCGAGVSVPTTDNVWHSMQAICNGASSMGNVDNVSPVTGSAGTNPLAVYLSIGSQQTGSAPWGGGYILEQGVWGGVGFTPTQQTNMCHNQYLAWGLPTSC